MKSKKSMRVFAALNSINSFNVSVFYYDDVNDNVDDND